MMRMLVLFVGLLLFVDAVPAADQEQANKEQTKEYDFPGLEWKFTTSGEFLKEVTTPAGRKLEAESKIMDIRQYGEEVYLVSSMFIRRYDARVDRDESRKDVAFNQVFRYVYQAPAHHEILGNVHWQERDVHYYPVYLRFNKKLGFDEETLVFRGLVRVYPMEEEGETRVQYLPYTRLPEEGQWVLKGFKSGNRELWFEVHNRKDPMQSRRIGFRAGDEFFEEMI